MTEAGPASGPPEGPDPLIRGAPLEPLPAGPPGGRIFSLEGRRAPGLYLVAWVLSVGGVALLFLAPMASSDLARAGLLAAGAMALLTGLAAGAGSQIVERRDRHPDRYHGPAPLLVFGVVLATSTILSGLLLRSGLLAPDRPIDFLLGLLLVAGLYALAVWLFGVRSGALSWRDMGWPGRDASVAELLRSVGIAVAVMLPVTLAILLFGGILATILDVQPPSVLPAAAGPSEALAVAIAAAVVAPVGEELFFRGFALTAWWRDLGAQAAIVRSALFFAFIHIVNITSSSFEVGALQAILQTAVILPLGLVLGWLFVRRGMVGAIAGHVTYNAFLLALLLLEAYLPRTA